MESRSHERSALTMRVATALVLMIGGISLHQIATAASPSGPLLATATVTASCSVGASSLAFPGATSAAARST